MRLRGVLFDFGYTLFAHAPLAVTISDCARRLGTELSDERATALAHRIDEAAMAPAELAHPRDFDSTVWADRWKVLYGIADEFGDGLGSSIYQSMHDPHQWIPYRQAASTLRALEASEIRVGVVSNTGWDVRRVFAAHSMATHVASFTLSYEVGAVKPDPRIFTVACESLGLSVHDVLMVGDDPRSDGGAVAVGICTLLLPPGHRGSDNGLGAVPRLVT
ncbi:MAG TPA: HAD family hydrolase [Ilumatobacteraceae bacterium]|nr:HAD family hydrolase [Ilumatobacteraceae bacterium]